ncbi:MAG TPA: amidohydrolase family protein [Polyangiaceae bacterium]|nr:amidohydrolase family protein [Polyangiaceae bacterium]
MSDFRLRWLRNRKRTDVELPLKAPIHLGDRSNAEYFYEATPQERLAEKLALEKAEEGARRYNIDRREFMASAMGVATTLAMINVAQGCSDNNGGSGGGGQGGSGGGGPRDGGYYDVGPNPMDADAACASILDPSKEFIFDIQTHHVNRSETTAFASFLRQQQHYARACNPGDPVACFSRNEYARLMFLESDTTVAVLSGLPAPNEEASPIANHEIAETRDAINAIAAGTERVVNHHMVLPNRTGKTASDVAAQLEAMETNLARVGKIGAWKTYPAWSPNNTQEVALDGYRYDDPVLGVPMIERGLELGVNTFCIHKGLPIVGFSEEFNDPKDIGVIAKRFSQANFIVYHSGFLNQRQFEIPYTQGSRAGTNSLITALIENQIGPGQNVYAELGTSWQFAKGDPSAAAHMIGKLLKYVGEDNVVWGTDCMWYGSPQEQITAFLQFQISEAFQTQYGYPALTMERKRKILGLNAARIYGVDVQAARCAVDRSALAQFKRSLDAEYGRYRWAFEKPKLTTRRDFWRVLREHEFKPG